MTPWITKPVPFNIGQGAAAASSGGGADFESDYTNASLWTPVGSEVDVNSTVADHVANNNADASTNSEVYQSLGFTLDNELWYADFQWTSTAIAASSPPSTFPIIFSSTTGVIRDTSNDALGIMTQGTYMMWYTRDATTPVDGGHISISLDTLYYLRFERTSATGIKLSVFSDSARTTNISGSPKTATISSSIQDLDIIHHGVCGTISNNTSSWNGTNVRVYNGVSP